MKRLLLIVLPLLLIVGCSKPINEETLIDKDGLKYHPDTKELYSGKVFQNRMGGGKEFEGSYKDGKKDGIWTTWYENGQKEVEQTFKDGIGDGLHTEWYENGQKFKEVTWKDGKKDGLYTGWYENEQKKEEGTFKDGKEDGLTTIWYENGQKKEEVTFKDGEELSSKEWNEDGSVRDIIIIDNRLVIEDIIKGNGKEANDYNKVIVNYTGKLEDGSVFDSSLKPGRGPFTFTLGVGSVIKGWDLGVKGMKVGGKRKLTIPAELGYGDRGAGSVIPPGATLIFEVELLKVETD